MARHEKGELDGALSDFDRAIALDPQQAAFYSNRGRAWLAEGEPERALSDFNRAITLNPTLVETWLYRGAAWFDKRDFARAIADFDQTLKLNPRMADAHCNRGVTRQQLIKSSRFSTAPASAIAAAFQP